MPITVPANGQFGPDVFLVYSDKGVAVNAKYLRDATGTKYIVDPTDVLGKPYTVPLDYDPKNTITYFSNIVKQDFNADAISGLRTSVYQELHNAFKIGGSGDLQRPLPD